MYRYFLLLFVLVNTSFSVYAQKEEVINYLDSTYYRCWSYNGLSSFDGWHIKKYREIYEKSIYLVDTNQQVLVETQIKTKEELFDVMDHLSDTVLFDTLMLNYYDIFNHQNKSAQYIKEGNFIPVNTIKMTPNHIDSQGVFSHISDEINLGDSIFRRGLYFEQEDFKLEVNAEYSNQDLEYRRGLMDNRGIEIKLRNHTDSIFSLYIETLDFMDFQDMVVFKLFDNVSIIYYHSTFSMRDNVLYGRRVGHILINLKDLTYKRSHTYTYPIEF